MKDCKQTIKEVLRVCIIIMHLYFVTICISCKKEQEIGAPVVSTSPISDISGTSASGGGQIKMPTTGNILAKGVCWSTDTVPTLSDSKTSDGSGPETFTSKLTGLNGATEYYVRAYATNIAGTGYGNVLSFTTLGSIPVTSVLQAINITTSSATLMGTVNPNELSTKVIFEYGTTTQYGKSVNSFVYGINGKIYYIVGANIDNLDPGKLYHYRTRVENTLGITYSEDMTFTTVGMAPTVLTLPPLSIMAKSVRFEANINANSLLTTVTFEYGTTTDYGSSVAASESGMKDSLIHKFTAGLSELEPNTTYHFRVQAVNILGTTYGNDIAFTTNPAISDVDGNIYSIVTIGSQIWMQENLKTTKFNDNTPIPLVTGSSWGILPTPGYCYFLDDSLTYANIYGIFYNWYAVNTGKMCPLGWHVPDNEEWAALSEYLGGSDVAGPKMMIAGKTYWSNLGTNESGFTALPSCYRNGPVWTEGGAYWYSSSNISSTAAEVIGLNPLFGYDIYYGPKSTGINVRCIKD